MIDIQSTINEHLATVKLLNPLIPQIQEVADLIVRCLRDGGKVLWMGNGGSAADSQHLAAELVGRYTRERRGLPSIALTTDTSVLTAVGNDYGFDAIFVRQVEALCVSKDVLIGISTSGNSPNILEGIKAARALGAHTVGLAGNDGGRLAAIVDICLTVPASETARIQEAQILLGHIICDWVESELVDSA